MSKKIGVGIFNWIDVIVQEQHNDLRSFGLIIGGGLCLLFGVIFPYFYHINFSLTCMLVGLCFVGISLLQPKLLKPLRIMWHVLSKILAYTQTRLILGVLYFFLITPIGIVKRLCNNLTLGKIERDVQTYRITSEHTPVQRFERPF